MRRRGEVAEQLSRDAGYDPVFIGGLDKARMQEDFLFGIYGAASQAFEGPIFYRFAKPGDRRGRKATRLAT